MFGTSQKNIKKKIQIQSPRGYVDIYLLFFICYRLSVELIYTQLQQFQKTGICF